jgi:glutathione synthase/RimK-type ligase-like ATP-grasp enzyme
MKESIRVAIVYCRKEELGQNWAVACQGRNLDYNMFDISSSTFFSELDAYAPDIVLTRPPGNIELDKTLFDEKTYVLSKIKDYFLFPSYEETVIYENKRVLSYHLEAWNLPHPQTKVFYSKDELNGFASRIKYPIVVKSSIGASGTGVHVIRTHKQLRTYAKRAFSSKGMPVRIGPNRNTGNIFKWLSKALRNPKYAKERVAEYKTVADNRPKRYVIIQDYVPHEFEWRVAKIGDSYFAHKKIKHKDKCSGTKGIDYVDPPVSLLEFVKQTCGSFGFNSVAIDLFEVQGKYLINEIQTIFGHVQDHILEVDGKPGRYLDQDGKWVFEEGMFNSNKSFNLRLEVALKLYRKE